MLIVSICGAKVNRLIKCVVSKNSKESNTENEICADAAEPCYKLLVPVRSSQILLQSDDERKRWKTSSDRLSLSAYEGGDEYNVIELQQLQSKLNETERELVR